MQNSCSYTSSSPSLMEEDLAFSHELLFSTVLDTSEEPLETLSGPEIDEVLNQSVENEEQTQLTHLHTENHVNILDISDNRTSSVQYPHISSSFLTYTPPSSPTDTDPDSDGAWSYSDAGVSSTCSLYPESPITPKEEQPWYSNYPMAPDSSCRYFSGQPLYQNDVPDANNNNAVYLSPSHEALRYEDMESNVIFDEITDENDYEPWLKFEHVRPDGSCKCLDKKNVTKCQAQKTRRRRTNQLWHFLLEVLATPRYRRFIRWINREAGVFRFEQSQKVAQLWGKKKQRTDKKPMTYEYMSRAMRHYYIQGIMRRVGDKRLTYQFGPNAENWRRYAVPAPVA